MKLAVEMRCRTLWLSWRFRPVRSIRVLSAFFPEAVRKALAGSMAEQGITAEDLRELIRRLKVRHENNSYAAASALSRVLLRT